MGQTPCHAATPRSRASRPLDLALWQLACAMAVLVVIECVLLADNTSVPYAYLLGFPLIGVVYLSAGLVAWRRRPGNRMGALMVWGGLVYLLVGLANVQVPGLIALGQLVASVPLALIVHLLLAFPSGRLRSRTARLVVIIGYLICTVLQLPGRCSPRRIRPSTCGSWRIVPNWRCWPAASS